MDDQILKAQLEISEANQAYRQAVADDKDETEVRSLFEAVQKAEQSFQRILKDTQAKDKEAPQPEQSKSELPEVSLREYITAAVENRSVQGAEREVLEEKKLSGVDGVIPWEALATQTEHRADKATAVAAAAIGSNNQGILGRIFNRTAANFLGVSMPMVPRGDALYTVLTAGDSGAVKSQGTAHDAVASTFTGKTIKPTRLTARYVISVEDMARFNGLEDTLRNDLQMALGVALDNQIINGSGSGANFTGILKTLGSLDDPDKTSTYADYVSLVASGVDGKSAGMLSDVRLATDPTTFKHAITVTNAGSGENGYEYLQRASGGVIVSAQIPKKTTIRTTMAMDAVAPIWEGVQLIRDPYSKAQAGEVALTVVVLAGFALLRTSGWAAVKIKND